MRAGVLRRDSARLPRGAGGWAGESSSLPGLRSLRRDCEHDREVRTLYEEMEQQLREQRLRLRSQVGPKRPRPPDGPRPRCARLLDSAFSELVPPPAPAPPRLVEAQVPRRVPGPPPGGAERPPGAGAAEPPARAGACGPAAAGGKRGGPQTRPTPAPLFPSGVHYPVS